MESFDLDIDSTTFTETRIFRAIKATNHYKLLQAINVGEPVHLRDTEFQSTYLHVLCSLADSTCEEKYVPMIYQLSNAGIDVNAKDYKGRTALELAIGRELQDIMVALLRVGTDPTERNYKKMIQENGSPFEYELLNTVEKYEPGLWFAVKNNDTSMIFMLINSWCRININHKGVTLLQMARHLKRADELINTLDDYEVTIEFVHATLAGDEKRMLEFLMDSKPCDPNIMDISYQERWSMPLEPRSLRDTAFCMGHTHILHLLPEDEADEPSSEGEPRPARHIRDKGRSATAMAITSLNGYLTESDLSRPLGNIMEDKDSEEFDEIHEVPDEEMKPYRPRTARSQCYEATPGQITAPSSFYTTFRPVQPANTILPTHVQGKGSAKQTTAPNPSGGQSYSSQLEANAEGQNGKSFLFHEVDSFVEQYYVDGANPPYKTYVCRPNQDYSHNWKMVKKTDKRHTKSKMCVVS